ncbi:MAG: hypothetical protein K9I94_04530 [Bacteroidales bacterium]|nr:hypothetical protein [Bacteroidales bacterium]
MDKFQNKYRIPSARLKNWDYGWNAAYFVTICTANRECYFGDIKNDEIVWSETGKLANQFLMEIPQRYEYADLDEFVVMPNHVHAIVIIKKTGNGRRNVIDDHDGGTDDRDAGDGRDAINRVSTGPNPKKPGGITGNKNPMLHDNISRIFNWYKGRVTFESRKINADFAWQSRFYDHIIRNDMEYQRIKNYIINNPRNWNDDTLNP